MEPTGLVPRLGPALGSRGGAGGERKMKDRRTERWALGPTAPWVPRPALPTRRPCRGGGRPGGGRFRSPPPGARLGSRGELLARRAKVKGAWGVAVLCPPPREGRPGRTRLPARAALLVGGAGHLRPDGEFQPPQLRFLLPSRQEPGAPFLDPGTELGMFSRGPASGRPQNQELTHRCGEYTLTKP